MAQSTCRACGREVSPDAVTCPACGAAGPAARGRLAPARRRLGVGLLVAAAVVGVGSVTDGALADLAAAGAETLPLVGVALLARLGVEHRGFRVAAWGLATLLVLLYFATTFGLALAVWGPAQPGAPPREPGALAAVGFGLLGALALTLLTLVGGVRRALSRVVPIAPDDPVHTLALFLVVALGAAPLASLLGTGEPLLLAQLGRGDVEPDWSPASMMYGLAWLVPGAFVAAGYGLQRDGGETVDRLGLRSAGGAAWAWAALVGVALVPAVLVFDQADDGLWRLLGVPTTDETRVEALFEGAFTPAGAVALALTAGVGEELAVRGLLQPRLGIALSSLLFAALHGFQYGVDGLTVVFLLGVAFGWLRRRSGTVSAMVAHGVYDLVVVVVGFGVTG